MKNSIKLCMGFVFFSTFTNSFAHVNTSCQPVGSLTECVFSGGGNDLTDSILNVITRYPNNIKLHIQAGNYLLKPFVIDGSIGTSHTNIILHLDPNVSLKAPPEGDPSWKNQDSLIAFKHINHLEVSGDNQQTSLIDGYGSSWWTKDMRKPVLLSFENVNYLAMNNIQFINPPFHTVHLFQSSYINIDSVTVNAPVSAVNTDGFDLYSSQHVNMSNLNISNGDDGIAINTYSNNPTLDHHAVGPTTDVNIQNATLSNGHGLAIGSLVYGNVNNINIKNINIYNTEYGLRIKTRCDSSCSQTKNVVISNINYSQVSMNNVKFPLYFDLSYNSTNNSFSYVNLNNISFDHISSTNSQRTSSLICQKRNICSPIKFSNMSLDTNASCQGVNGGSTSKGTPCY